MTDGPASQTGRVGALSRALEREEERLLTCVHCGFCLPACPTYVRLGDEGDSPRGRLHLMRAVAEGRLDPAADAFQTHIDRCLGCRACEPVCPSGVPYGHLLERAREAAAEARAPSFLTRGALTTFSSRLRTRVAMALARGIRGTGLPARLARGGRRSGGPPSRVRLAAAMLASTAPDRLPVGEGGPGAGAGGSPAAAGAPPPRSRTAAPLTGAPSEGRPGPGAVGAAGSGSDLGAGTSPGSEAGSGAGVSPEAETARTPGAEAEGGERGGTAGPTAPGRTPAPDRHTAPDRSAAPDRHAAPAPDATPVAFLRGCVQEGLYARVNRATERTLEANGCRIADAPGQGCCGALHAHAGDLEGARRLARRNVDAFEASGAGSVVVNAAGCGAVMKEYGTLLEDDPEYAERAERVARSVRDVSRVLAERGPREGAELPVEVTYDAPCHLLHAQGVDEAPLRVLGAVPGLRLVPLPDASECCGGAGLYGINHPELGGSIGRDKVESVLSTGARVVATGNPGCMMQIGAGLRLAGSSVAIRHPVELLDESYRRAGLYDEDSPAAPRGDD